MSALVQRREWFFRDQIDFFSVYFSQVGINSRVIFLCLAAQSTSKMFSWNGREKMAFSCFFSNVFLTRTLFKSLACYIVFEIFSQLNDVYFLLPAIIHYLQTVLPAILTQ